MQRLIYENKIWLKIGNENFDYNCRFTWNWKELFV